MPPEIQCAASPADGGRTIIRYRIRNVDAEAIHLIDSQRLPYQLVHDASTLVILHGVNPPDPDTLYNVIEIPLTRPLAPGETLTGELSLPIEMLRDHYGEQPAPDNLQKGTIRVRCEVGWGTTPIAAADRARMSIRQLLAWQRLTGYGPFEVVLH